MQESFDLTTLIFLALAVFVIWRLRSVLGTKTGNEKPPQDPFRRETSGPRGGRPGADNVVRLPNGAAGAPASPDRWKSISAPGADVTPGLDEIARQEPAFNGREFLEGAKMAYEMIVTAFAAGDRKTLKDLLSKEVYEGFEAAIADRETRGEKAETTFVAIDKAEVTAAEVKGKTAQITVRIVSELISVTRSSAGDVVEGSADQVVDVTDVWTFARQLGARDPNWQLVATEAGQ
ncbi:Tim44/TimA family putative adaptor protein [Salinarimonas sp. NSM]|uniref:Tim44/TimA family putative adaptor protein n=1 Tax=Salinarimonas sp. NSM TaxID=3458003 RepID=UPI004037214C